MSDPDLMNSIDLLRIELEKFNNALYSVGTDSLLVQSTALADPQSIDDWSMNLPQMQQQADPYPLGVPDPAVNLAEELERLRYQLAVIMGEAFWYIDPDATIAAMNAAVIALQLAVVGLQAGHAFDSAMHTDVAAMAEAEGDLSVWQTVALVPMWRTLARGADNQVLRSTATSIAWETVYDHVVCERIPVAGAAWSASEVVLSAAGQGCRYSGNWRTGQTRARIWYWFYSAVAGTTNIRNDINIGSDGVNIVNRYNVTALVTGALYPNVTVWTSPWFDLAGVEAGVVRSIIQRVAGGDGRNLYVVSVQMEVD